MAGINEVLERLVSEPGFGARLFRDPRATLAGYDLSADDLDVLASRLTTDAGGMGPVERRTSRAALMALFSQLVDTATVREVDAFAEPQYEAMDGDAADLDPYADDDGDGLKNFTEMFGTQTDPFNPDTDGDGLGDGVEAGLGTNPSNPDTDGDGLSDGSEVALGTHPQDWDTDNDGVADGDEVTAFGTDPLDQDSDDDGLSDWEETLWQKIDSNPNDSDTDNDGILDGEEVHGLGTNPNASDTDGDGLSDKAELEKGSDPTNPYDADTDGDGLTDILEGAMGTNPNLADSDGDGLNDGEETAFDWGGDSADTDTDPMKWDTDNDTWSDGAEVKQGTDPHDPNSHPTGIVGSSLPASAAIPVPSGMDATDGVDGVDPASAGDGAAIPSGGPSDLDPAVAAEPGGTPDVDEAADPPGVARGDAPIVRGPGSDLAGRAPATAADEVEGVGPSPFDPYSTEPVGDGAPINPAADEDLGVEMVDDGDTARGVPPDGPRR